MIRSSSVSALSEGASTSEGEPTVWETLQDGFPSDYYDVCLEMARRAQERQAAEGPLRQRILEVDAETPSARLARFSGLTGEAIADRVRREELQWPIDVWLALALEWCAVVTQQTPPRVREVEGRWIIDVAQLGVLPSGARMYGHARLDSVFEGLHLIGGSEFAPLPVRRHPLQWGSGPRDGGVRAQVRDLGFSLAVLLTGQTPYAGEHDLARVQAWASRAPGLSWGSLAPLGQVLERAMAFDPRARFEDLHALAQALAEASGVEPATSQRCAEWFRSPRIRP